MFFLSSIPIIGIYCYLIIRYRKYHDTNLWDFTDIPTVGHWPIFRKFDIIFTHIMQVIVET